MPMCHNIIEAMAVGAIPITNYPEWFDPKLIHMENCMAFASKKDLVERVKAALTLSPEEVARMQRNVVDYYEQYLRAERFVRRVEDCEDSKVTVLLFTEGNVARNSTKLNRHSVLTRGTALNRDLSGIKRVLPRMFQRS